MVWDYTLHRELFFLSSFTLSLLRSQSFNKEDDFEMEDK